MINLCGDVMNCILLVEFGMEGGCLVLHHHGVEQHHEDVDEHADCAGHGPYDRDGFVRYGYGGLVEFVVVLDFVEDGLLGGQQSQYLLALRLPIARVHQLVLGLVGQKVEQSGGVE